MIIVFKFLLKCIQFPKIIDPFRAELDGFDKRLEVIKGEITAFNVNESKNQRGKEIFF